MAEFVALAAVTSPHGVRGQVKLRSLTKPAEGFLDYPALQQADGTPVKLRVEGRVQDQFIVRIDGVNTRTEAERWRGKQFGIPHAALPALESETEFYHRELVGMQVVDAAGAPCGTVCQVANYGASDLLEIEHQGRAEFYAFTSANFPRIDRVARIIEFHPPEILVAGKEKS